MMPLDYAIIATLALLSALCAGVALGMWLKQREAYRIGHRDGMAEASRLYSRIVPDALPRLQPRNAPFAGRGRP
jgi:hypothetical protein